MLFRQQFPNEKLQFYVLTTEFVLVHKLLSDPIRPEELHRYRYLHLHIPSPMHTYVGRCSQRLLWEVPFLSSRYSNCKKPRSSGRLVANSPFMHMHSMHRTDVAT